MKYVWCLNVFVNVISIIFPSFVFFTRLKCHRKLFTDTLLNKYNNFAEDFITGKIVQCGGKCGTSVTAVAVVVVVFLYKSFLQ